MEYLDYQIELLSSTANLKLFSILRFFDPMNFNYKYCLLLLVSTCFSTSISSSANALYNYNADNIVDPSVYLAQSQDIKSNGKTDSREYTFKAPDSKKISNTEQLVKVRGYKVEVYGSETELLQQVRHIEPSAFIKGNAIQVGIFSEQVNAENMVRKLAVEGFWARIKAE